MRVLVDSSIIVDIDRQNKDTVNLLKNLVEKNIELIISTITVSEILTGSYLKTDVRLSVLIAKEILNQFLWVDFDGKIAEKTAQLLAFLLTENKEIEYQDTCIAASFLVSHCDFLLTQNKKDFIIFPQLEGKVFTAKEFESEISK